MNALITIHERHHFFFSGETTVGQNDHDIKLNGALVAETHW